MRNGSEVFMCMMDMTKAFDLVKHSILFNKFISAGLSLIFIRLLLVIYMLQYADVRWDNCFSYCFPLSNGVRQGAILSAIAYCYYCQELFSLLRRRRSGLWISGKYCGILGY